MSGRIEKDPPLFTRLNLCLARSERQHLALSFIEILDGEIEVRLLGMPRGNGDSSVGFDVNIAAQKTKRESLWSKARQAKHPEELKTWQGHLDVVNPDGAEPAVHGKYSRLR